MHFDTNVIINILNLQTEKDTYDFVDFHIKNKTAFISAIVYSEILAFPKLTAEEREVLDLYIVSNFKILLVSKAIAKKAAEIVAFKRNQTGKKLKLTDAIIAATAILNKKTLFTFDEEDFSDLALLKLHKM
jgi:predicted nucleic acid-binding protein